MKKRRVLSVVLAASMFAMLLTGCGGGNQGSAEGSQAAAIGQGVAEAESCIKIGVSGTPDLDPAIVNTGSSLIAAINIYDTLIFPSNEADEGVIPRVAEDWTISEDGLTYTFNLKKGIKFHNGDELTASDVVYSMDRLLTIGEGYAYIFTSYVEPGTTVAVDDYTVEFHLKQAYGPFINALVRLYILNEDEVKSNTQSAGNYGENGDYGRTYLLTHDAGSGAYKAVELVQQDYFYAEQNPDWFMGWENEKAPKAFKQMAITEATTVRTMINNKEMDITDTWQSVETLSALSKIDGISIAKYSNGLEYNVYMNTQAAPMDDINFRRAMNCVIDYDTILNSIFPDSVKATGPVPAGVMGHVDTKAFKFDIEQAKKYIAASKYANDYANYPIEIVVNSDVSDLEKIALMMQSAAKEIGVTITIAKAPWVSLIDQMGSVETSPQITIINSAPPFDDAGIYLQSRYGDETKGTWENGEWLADSTVNDMIEDALGTTDTDERLAKYADIQNYIVDEVCPSAWLCDLSERCAYQSSYVTWPFVEQGGVPQCVNGYSQVYSEFEYNLDQK